MNDPTPHRFRPILCGLTHRCIRSWDTLFICRGTADSPAQLDPLHIVGAGLGKLDAVAPTRIDLGL